MILQHPEKGKITMSEKAESKYTPAIVSELSTFAKTGENGKLNWAMAQEFGEKHDFKPMGVVLCAKKNNIPYAKKERVTRSGAKVISKAELVASIAKKIGVTVEALDGLEKSTKTALEAVLES